MTRHQEHPTHETVRWTVSAALLAALLLTLTAMPVPAASATGSGLVQDDCGQSCRESLALARNATAKYRRESVALAEGFVPDPICIAVPGVGGMGIHYPNAARMADIEVDPGSPEILLYEERDGERHLVALEYYAPALSGGEPWFGGELDPPPFVDNPPPVLFGRTFAGPMPGHNPTMPWHYDLHVWAWRANPAGMFTQFNPRVECP